MKKIFSLLILLTVIKLTVYGQTKHESFLISNKIDSTDFAIEEFKPIPTENAFGDRSELFDKIKPKKEYVYWECYYKDIFDDEKLGQLIAYNGDSLNYADYAIDIEKEYGFFVECHPSICFNYIIGIQHDKTIDIIDTNDKFREFIGEIDNLEEVILSVKLHDYWIDSDSLIGGAYKERDDDYLMYLLDYSSTPVTYKSVRAVLTKKGLFSVFDKKIYKQTNEYIID